MPEQSTPSNSGQFRIPYETRLNASQYEAITATEGPLLVIAGAGSGKTRTLTYRVARLVEAGVSPSGILLLTFTRKAAQQMLERATELLDSRCGKVAGGTFHSFGNSILRKYAPHMGLAPGFAIMDRADAEAAISILRKEIHAGPKHRSFPRKHTLANIFSRAVNKMTTIEDVVYDDYAHLSSDMEAIALIFQAYQNHKREHQLLDFDDLLVYLQQLLKGHPDIRERIASSYRYIMVDEYQDTNKIQAEILYLLTGVHQNIMVVGDDSQSIYAFRGANFRNIMEFPKMFPGTRIITLEENYRSVQPILNLTNVIIDQAMEKYSKTLFTRREGGSTPVLVSARDENSQSLFVVHKIQELIDQGVALNQIAVLFRAGFHSFDLEIELNREQMPFIKVGGFRFVESAHIKDVLAHLRVIANPHDRISWYRILLLINKIGPTTAQKVFEAIRNEGSGYTGLLTVNSTGGALKGLKRLKELFAQIDSFPMSVVKMGEAVVKHYLPILKERHDDHPKREKDLEQLLAIMERYDNLGNFLTDMALEPPNTSVGDTFAAESAAKDRLVLSTVHSAKGLEWHTVFIIWALDGRFPSAQSIYKAEDLEEELRLMYVAATRARENLYFTYPGQVYDRSVGVMLNQPSRFIAMVPEDILEHRWAESNF
ncbi:MAG: ATP-dependent helicase [Deltaproteobacteria bacterium]|jgi:DNA helicase-2/ATP-dependent DNA helicase PcrA|nr:ATP-dependent helicase [Deltaproteobacteria bacterium]MBW2478532.1 ATP-dependent helicase [Deltaproteobacteria bacterium]